MIGLVLPVDRDDEPDDPFGRQWTMARSEPPDPGLPIKLEPCGNGEFQPEPATEVAREATRRAHRAIEENAARVGMSRRDFLRTMMAAATTLSVLEACTRDSGQTGGSFIVDDPTTSSSTSTSPSSSSTVTSTEPPPSTVDEDAAAEAIGPSEDEFIFDVQGHLLEFGDGIAGTVPNFPQAACGEADPKDCYGLDHFLEALFVESDTHMVMLSSLPFAFDALSPDVMRHAMETADRFGCSDRVLMQGESHPTRLGFDAMAELAESHPISAFKTFTHTAGSPWRLDDDTGDAYLDHVERLGVPIVAVHKGFSGGSQWSSPVDIGPAAEKHPGVTLVVYHSGYEAGVVEGPLDLTRPSGVDRLVASLADSAIGAGDNVYPELGSTWRALMTRPDEAAHFLGKLLVAVGEDNILWGTDSIWYGSPQDQIQAFRAFQISEEFQERFGYPALTPETKRKILGYNAARLFGVEPVTEPCNLSREDLLALRIESTSTFHTHSHAADVTFRSA